MALRLKIIFVILGVLIGAFFSAQLRSSAPTGSFPTDVMQARVDLVKSFVAEQSTYQSRIVELRTAIETMQKKNEKATEKNSLAILETLKEQLGLTVLKDTGLHIFLDDSPSASREEEENMTQALIQASDLRDVINVLRVARAKAIAINHQRIIASTSITAVGNSILVNNVPLAPPFLITAIGDPESLARYLIGADMLQGLLDRKKEHHLTVDIRSKDALTVPVYSGDFRTKFLHPPTP